MGPENPLDRLGDCNVLSLNNAAHDRPNRVCNLAVVREQNIQPEQTAGVRIVKGSRGAYGHQRAFCVKVDREQSIIDPPPTGNPLGEQAAHFLELETILMVCVCGKAGLDYGSADNPDDFFVHQAACNDAVFGIKTTPTIDLPHLSGPYHGRKPCTLCRPVVSRA